MANLSVSICKICLTVLSKAKEVHFLRLCTWECFRTISAQMLVCRCISQTFFSWLACSQNTCFAASWNQIWNEDTPAQSNIFIVLINRALSVGVNNFPSVQRCAAVRSEMTSVPFCSFSWLFKKNCIFKQVWTVIISTGITQHLCVVYIGRVTIQIWEQISHFGNRIRQTPCMIFLNIEKDRQAMVQMYTFLWTLTHI